MVVKVSSLALFRRNFMRAHLSAYVSSISCADNIQIIPQNNEDSPNTSQFEANIRYLKNKLHPETLTHALSSTADLSSSLKLFKWASLQNRFRHTADTYYHIIMKLGMAGKVDEMEGFCNDMMKCRFSESENVLLGLIDEFIRHRKLDEAMRILFIFNLFSYKASIDLFNDLLGALMEEKKGFQSVLFVYKEMVKSSIVPTTETLNYLLEALFDDDRVDAALNQYKRMMKKGCCPNSTTYEIMVSGLICKNLLNEALVVLDEILENGCKLELNFFSHILPLLFRMNKQEVGLRLFEKMKASKIVPNSLIYEVLIKYFCNKKCIDDARNLLNEMIGNDLKPQDCVFIDLTNGYLMLNKFSEAKKFLEDGQVTEIGPYNALLEGYCQAGYFNDACGLFEKMIKKNITNSLSWNTFIEFLSKDGKNDIVSRVLGRMIVSAYAPDSVTYSTLIVGKCKSNEIDDALKIFHQACAENLVLHSVTYATLFESLCQMNKIQEANEVFRHMCSSNISCSNADYNIIMKGLSKLKKGYDLLVIFSRMIIEGCSLDVEAYNILIKSMSEHHQTIECILFLDLMVNEGLLPDLETLKNSLSCLAQHCQLHKIWPTIDKLFLDHKVFNFAIYNILIKGLLKEGCENEARRLLDVMLEKGWVPDATTHRLLIGSNGQPSKVSAYEKVNIPDEISSILSEGFGEL